MDIPAAEGPVPGLPSWRLLLLGLCQRNCQHLLIFTVPRTEEAEDLTSFK